MGFELLKTYNHQLQTFQLPSSASYFRIGFYPGKFFCLAEAARFGCIGVLDGEVYLPAFRACDIYIFPERAFFYPVNGHVAVTPCSLRKAVLSPGNCAAPDSMDKTAAHNCNALRIHGTPNTVIAGVYSFSQSSLLIPAWRRILRRSSLPMPT